jgi:hypothetical protein
MKSDANIRPGKIAIAIFIVLLSIGGLVISYWYGLGWLFLTQTIREFLFANSQLYLLLIRTVAGHTLEEAESSRLGKNRLFTSPALARRAVFSLALTILVFWKANIPLFKIIEIIRY